MSAIAMFRQQNRVRVLSMPDDFVGVAESNLVNVISYGNIRVEFSPSSVAADQYFSNQDHNTATVPTLFNATHGI